MSQLSNRYIRGWRYGVRFHDGSVRHIWNGTSQQDQAYAAYQKVKADYPRDNIEFVRANVLSPTMWEVAEAPRKQHVFTEEPSRHKRTTRH